MNFKKTYHIIRNPITIVIVALIIFIGVFFTYREVKSAEDTMGNYMLKEAMMVGASIDILKLAELKGEPEDINISSHHYIREQLLRIRSTNTNYRYLYIMGRKDNGVTFFYMGTAHPDSSDYSPPGQEYFEQSPTLEYVFEHKSAKISPPFTDRWGKWISALVPITDPNSGKLLAVFGMDFDAGNWNYQIYTRSLTPIIITISAIFLMLVAAEIIRRHQMIGDIKLLKQKEEELKRSELLFSSLLNFTPYPISLFDMNGTIIMINNSFEELFTRTKENIIGSNINEFIPRTTLNFSNVIFELTQDSVIEKDFSIFSKKGKRDIHSLSKIVNIQNVQYIFSVAIETTEKNRAEQEIKKLSQMIKQSPTSIFMTDASGNIEYVNPKFSEVTGYSSEEVIGKNPRIFKSGKMKLEQYKEMWDTIKSGNEWRGEFLNLKKDGTFFWESASISPFRNSIGEISGFISVKEDITEKKLLEIDLKNALDKSEESDRIKSALLLNMSHEFRTPMTGILGMATILRAKELDPKSIIMLNSIIQSGKRLTNTLNTILELANLESLINKRTPSPLNITKVSSEIIKKLQFLGKEKNIHIVESYNVETLFVKVSERHLEMIITQLVDNAIKFSDSGDVIVTIKERSDNENVWAELAIKDQGVGIPSSEFNKIFEEFRQVSEGTGRSHEGAGLGLTLVKKITSLYYGKIELDSNPGIGSTFRVLLPLENIKKDDLVASISDKIPTPLESLPLPITTLLIEDNSINYLTIESYLQDICQIDYCSNGTSGIEIAKTKQYMIILMDINLGRGIDGIETTKRIRQIDGYSQTPIVAVTGYSLDSDKDRFMEAGFSSFIAKPFEKDDLVNLVTQLLRTYPET